MPPWECVCGRKNHLSGCSCAGCGISIEESEWRRAGGRKITQYNIGLDGMGCLWKFYYINIFYHIFMAIIAVPLFVLEIKYDVGYNLNIPKFIRDISPIVFLSLGAFTIYINIITARYYLEMLDCIRGSGCTPSAGEGSFTPYGRTLNFPPFLSFHIFVIIQDLKNMNLWPSGHWMDIIKNTFNKNKLSKNVPPINDDDIAGALVQTGIIEVTDRYFYHMRLYGLSKNIHNYLELTAFNLFLAERALRALYSNNKIGTSFFNEITNRLDKRYNKRLKKIIHIYYEIMKKEFDSRNYIVPTSGDNTEDTLVGMFSKDYLYRNKVNNPFGINVLRGMISIAYEGLIEALQQEGKTIESLYKVEAPQA